MTQIRPPIRLALFGGGPGALIGAVHLRAALLDRRFELVAGAFSRDEDRSREQARVLRLPDERAYTSPEALIAGETGRRDAPHAIVIATPNDSHFPIAVAALEAGLHVISDKPMTISVDQAQSLYARVRAGDRVYAMTYTYTGYAMVREARALVAAGALGRVRKVVVTYSQGWLSDPIESAHPGAAWRTDPTRAGLGGCIGDIGVHAFQLAEYVSGERVRSLCADLPRVVSGRVLDDDSNVLLRFASGVPGVIVASQIALGERNGISVKVYGDEMSLSWSHDMPDELTLLHPDNRREVRFAGSSAIGKAGQAVSRLPAGHPEGLIEAFANVYGSFADAIEGQRDVLDAVLPGVGEGLRSILFVDAAIRSDQSRRWAELKDIET